MQPYCMIGNELDTVEPSSGFESAYSTVKTENSQGSMSSSLFNYLEAPYLSVSPMLALNDSFEVKSDEDASVDLNLDVSLQIRQFNQLETSFSADTDFRECSSVDQCNTFDQIHSNWNEFNVPDFLLGYDLMNSKSRGCADPTLAELNANGKSLFDDFTSSDCLPISEECSQFIFPTAPTSPQDSQDALILPTVASVCNGMIPNSLLPSLEQIKTENVEEDCSLRRSALQDLLLQNNSSLKRRSSPTPDIKTEIKSEPQTYEELPDFFHCIKRRQRTSTVSSTSSACESQPGTSSDITHRFRNECHYDYSTDKQDSDSNDDSLDSDGDYSNQSNYRSDEEKNFVVTRQRSRSMSTGDSRIKRRNKRGRFFWQYNLQSKGPKGNRLPLTTEFSNPHKLEQVTDPVFSPRCIIKGIKHTGKARKGDGNDLTPNPDKLHQIGQSLKNLNQIINDLTPVNELPVNVRPKSRKEKNKLASRVCRLKKKAQHEANKIKSYGLEHEHEQLLHILNEMKKQVKDASYKNKEQLLERCCSMEKELIKVKVAGRTVEFVNEILDKFATGVPSGGLDEL